jgi:hypothetical protein
MPRRIKTELIHRGPRKFVVRAYAKNQRRGIRRIRAMAMALEKIYGYSTTDVATHFKCTTSAVGQTLEWAEKEGILDELQAQVEELQRKVVKELAPKVIKVYNKALDQALETGDVRAAKDILKGFWNAKVISAKPPEDAGMDYEAYFIRRKASRIDETANAGALPLGSVPRLTEGTPAIDAEIVEQDSKSATVAAQAEPAGAAASEPGVPADR